MRFSPLSAASFSLLFLRQASQILAQESVITLTGSNIPTSLSRDDLIPTDSSGLYLTYESTATLSTTSLPEETETGTGTREGTVTGTGAGTSTSAATLSTTSNEFTVLVGSKSATTLSADETTSSENATATSTSAAAQPTNTRPCNGYPEFCQRNYSNITEVAAHNSPFVRSGNIASNQGLDVTIQLNDGIRMLQFQTHDIDGTIYLCHTSCDLLNAGTLEDYLKTVTEWLKANPYDVITILIGNANFVAPTNYMASIENSGLVDYVYTPSKIPMSLDDWPTLSQLILSGQRAVVFMDYKANQTAVPYILDEFSQMWETQFSPTNRAFPCDVHRPPGLSNEDAKKRMYIANHNLNTEVSLAGVSLLVPNTVLLNETNAVSGFGSAGAMGGNCTEKWNRPPNFLLVDYYNIGNVNGSIFQVAAELNNVTYNGKCCGSQTSDAPNGILLSLSESLKTAYVLMMVTTIIMTTL